MRILPLALGLLALNLTAAEEKPLPKELPPYGADKPLPAPELQRRILPNGLEVWMVPRTGLPRVNVMLAVKGGNASDPAATRGISSLVAQLLKEGTRTHDARTLAQELQGIGGEASGSAGQDGTYLWASSLDWGAPRLVGILGEIAREPAFPETEVVQLRERTLASIQAREADPSFQARRAFMGALYGEHPYSHVGLDPAWVKNLDRAQIAKAHAARFRPDRALLLVVGAFDAKAVGKAVDQALGSWKAEGAAIPDVTPPTAAPKPAVVIKERPDSVQTALVLGRRALPEGHPDLPALSLAVEVAGGAFGSRITRNIREDKGYTYSPYMSLSKGLAAGTVAESAAVRTAVTGATVTEVFYELARMGAVDVPADELVKAKRSLAGSYLFQTLSLDAYGSALASAWLMGQPAESLAAWVPKIQAVTAADVKRAARTYLAPKTFTIVAVGDSAAIKQELAPWME